MQAGKLRQRITVQRYSQQQDQETGELIQTWTDYCTVWADVSDLSTKDYIAAQANQVELKARALIRYSATTASITSSDRVLFEGYYYRIDGKPARDLDSRREFITINLAAGDAAWNQ